jgi:hypothetical protein
VQSSYCCKVGTAVQSCEWRGDYPECPEDRSRCASNELRVLEDREGAYYETHNMNFKCARK